MSAGLNIGIAHGEHLLIEKIQFVTTQVDPCIEELNSDYPSTIRAAQLHLAQIVTKI